MSSAKPNWIPTKVDSARSETSGAAVKMQQQQQYVTTTITSSSIFKKRVEAASASSSSIFASSSHPVASSMSASSEIGTTVQEPISILGRGRRFPIGFPSSSNAPRYSVKFSNSKSDEATFPTSSPNFPEHGVKFRSPPELYQRETTSGGVPETLEEATEMAYGAEAVFPISRMKPPQVTRTPDKNSLIASMELKVPCIMTPSTSQSPENITSTMAFSEQRGLTILSPHNPCPDLHFSSTFTVRTKKGKTVVLPKLKLPGIQSHSHDSIFLG